MIEIGGNQRARGLMNMIDGVEHPNQIPTTFVETHEARIVLMKYDALPIRYFWTFLFNCFNSSN